MNTLTVSFHHKIVIYKKCDVLYYEQLYGNHDTSQLQRLNSEDRLLFYENEGVPSKR